MKEIVGIISDPSEVEWWKKSASAWGAEKFIIAAEI